MSMQDDPNAQRGLLAWLMSLFQGGGGQRGGFPPAPGQGAFPAAPGGAPTDMSAAGPWGAGMPGLDMTEAGPWGGGSAPPVPRPQPRPETTTIIPKLRTEQLHEDRWNNRNRGLGGF